jgi:hypothetical protein
MTLFVVLPLQLMNPQQGNLEGLLVVLIDNDKEASMSKVGVKCNNHN